MIFPKAYYVRAIANEWRATREKSFAWTVSFNHTVRKKGKSKETKTKM
jgi:hypothetical protein